MHWFVMYVTVNNTIAVTFEIKCFHSREMLKRMNKRNGTRIIHLPLYDGVESAVFLLEFPMIDQFISHCDQAMISDLGTEVVKTMNKRQPRTWIEIL